MQYQYFYGGFYNDKIDFYLQSARSGYALPPTYTHRTDTTIVDGQLNDYNWDRYFQAALASGLKIAGYAHVYYMHKNQEDATFQVSSDSNGYTIVPSTNGYNAQIVVKVNAGTVTGVYEGATPIEYFTTPDGYVTFEVQNGSQYTVSTSGEPPSPPGPNQPPVASASVSPSGGTVGTVFGFSSAGSVDSDGSIASYSWSFGDGGTSASANPTHVYSSAGTYAASLTVTDDDGASDSDSVSVTVSTTPSPPPTEGAQIVIDSSMIDEELTDFPLMVKITNPAILSHDRKSLSITTAGGSECYVEIESWDSSEAILWVKVPTISPSVDTKLILSLLSSPNTAYVGDTLDATTPYVWSNGYTSVFHFAGHTYDSGPARNDGIIHGTVSFSPAKIGLGAEIIVTANVNGGGSAIELPDHPNYSPINNDPWTTAYPSGYPDGITSGRICVQMIWQPEQDWPGVAYGNWRVALGKQGNSAIEYKFNTFGSYETYGPRRFYVFLPSGGYGSAGDMGERTGHLPLEVGRAYLLHGQTFRDWDEGGGIVGAYEDAIAGFGVSGEGGRYQGGDIDEDIGFNNYAHGEGVPPDWSTKIEIADTSESLWVGNTPAYIGPPHSIIDEVRVSKVNRNIAWMKAELHNMNGELVTLLYS
jgi:PKD repeat protein